MANLAGTVNEQNTISPLVAQAILETQQQQQHVNNAASPLSDDSGISPELATAIISQQSYNQNNKIGSQPNNNIFSNFVNGLNPNSYQLPQFPQFQLPQFQLPQLPQFNLPQVPNFFQFNPYQSPYPTYVNDRFYSPTEQNYQHQQQQQQPQQTQYQQQILQLQLQQLQNPTQAAFYTNPYLAQTQSPFTREAEWYKDHINNGNYRNEEPNTITTIA